MKKMKLNIQLFSIPHTYIEFEDFPSTNTPLTAANLNQMQSDIYDDIRENGGAQIVDSYSTSTTDGYSANYVNNLVKDIYSTNEVKTNKVWINNKPIYRKVFTLPAVASITPNTWHTLLSYNFTTLDQLIRSTISSSESNYPAELNFATVHYSRPDNEFKVLHTRTASINIVANSYLICEYTKTTD